MGTILYPTDFSANSLNALHYAIALARKFNYEINILNVYPIPVAAPDVPVELMMAESFKRDADKDMNRILEEARSESPGLAVTTTISAGSVAPEIKYHANNIKPDLIVMGTTGAEGFKKLLLGSNAADVISKSFYLVLAVPASIPYKGFKEICFATDFNYDEIDFIESTAKWVKAFDANLTLLHINDGYASEEMKNDANYVSSFIEKVKEMTGIKSIEVETASDPNIVNAISDYLLDSETDLLIMARHKRNMLSQLLHPSVTKEIAQRLLIPLLVYPFEHPGHPLEQ
jgi:nucleotide-binding universal stress UspA family protein